MLARPAEMEPGFWFRDHAAGMPLEWLGVEPVTSSRPTAKRWVRVLVGAGGRSFVCDADARFQVVDWGQGR